MPQAIQHVGVTTSNLTKSVVVSYQCNGWGKVLNAGGDGWKGDDVYQLLMQAALVRGGAAESFMQIYLQADQAHWMLVMYHLDL